jgi:hypothetical protein
VGKDAYVLLTAEAWLDAKARWTVYDKLVLT